MTSADADADAATATATAASAVADAEPPAAAAAGGGGEKQLRRSDWRLDTSGRYQHRKSYLLQLAEEAGFEVRTYDKVVARRRHPAPDADPVHAHLFVLAKPPPPPPTTTTTTTDTTTTAGEL